MLISDLILQSRYEHKSTDIPGCSDFLKHGLCCVDVGQYDTGNQSQALHILGKSRTRNPHPQL